MKGHTSTALETQSSKKKPPYKFFRIDFTYFFSKLHFRKNIREVLIQHLNI